MTEEVQRRTKRRYAHELYPHAEEGEIRPLAVEVPYLYARAIGMQVFGTSWFDQSPELAAARTNQLLGCRQVALMADAMSQGLTGQEAWEWADGLLADETGECVMDRARDYGVDVFAIKPYPCGPEPGTHDHIGPPDHQGYRWVTSIDGRESDCPDCTEEVS